MVRLLTDGGEGANPYAIWDVVNILTGQVNFDYVINTYASSLYNFTPRTGNGMYALDSGTYLRKDFRTATSNTELYWGFAIRLPILATAEFFVAYTDDPGVYTNRLALAATADGRVNVLRSGTSIVTSVAGVLTVNQWYYIEVWFKPLNSGGRAVVKVDGVTVVDYTGDTTNEEEFINAWQISGVEGYTSARMFTCFDDIVCNDTSGAVNNSWPGQVRLLPIRPHADGTYGEWTRAALDLGYDAAQARNGAWGGSMLQTASADQKVTFDPEVPDLPAGATITNVVLSVTARVEAGAGVIAPMVISGATESISADQTLLSAWRNFQYAWAVNPADSAAWDEADLATLELGVSS